MDIPISIRNQFDSSPALDQHIARRLDSALRTHERHIQRVDIRLSDANGPRKGPDDKITLIEIALKPFGEIVARGESEDVYKSVTTATARVKQALSRYAGRLERQGRRTKVVASEPAVEP
jgi:ribosomal subunit interface protein